MDARKNPLSGKQALDLARGVDEIYAAKGKQVIHRNLKKDQPDAATLAGLLLGRWGADRVGRRATGALALVGTGIAVAVAYAGQLPALATGYLAMILLASAFAPAQRGAWPLGIAGVYDIDDAHLAHYARAARTREGFQRYLDEFVCTPAKSCSPA